MEMNEKKCCGTCIYHKKEDIDQGWVCVNPDSEYIADWTEYGDSCEDWEGWHTIGVQGGQDK